MQHRQDAVQIFRYASEVSRAWLPALLDNLATIPATLCGGDGCSIFLIWRNALHLAATTRPDAKDHLFDPAVSYTIDKARLRRAADDLAGNVKNPDGSLTGWVAAFDCPLNLKDQRSPEEHQAFASRRRGVPPPLWSNRGGGFYELPGPRPFLAVPMRYRERVYGVIRVISLRLQAQAFTDQHQQRLLDFGAHFAAFLVEHDLLGVGLEHYFRIWAARDGAQLARCITEAIPSLFGVDSCSFFQRDDGNRFVLRHSSASDALKRSKTDYEHFKDFQHGSIGNLFYEAGGSKTGVCIATQSPLLLHRGSTARRNAGRWTVVVGGAQAGLRSESNGRFLNAKGTPSHAHCEIHPARSRALLIVPVRDTVNPRQLSGVLRVVSTQSRKLTERNLVELEQFGDELGHRLGETTRREVQQQSARRLIEELANLEIREAAGGNGSGSQRWAVAARIVAQALDANAATVFLRREDRLVTDRNWSYLNVDAASGYATRDLEVQHVLFQEFCVQMRYEDGQGRTGWPAAHKKILNLKDLDDPGELKRWNVEAGRYDPVARSRGPHPFCEILEPGPFIAAPILLPGCPTVAGVVRALRMREGTHGPFTAAHELVLNTCTTILGGFLRVGGKPAVVISYASAHANLKDQLHSILNAVGIEPLSTGGEAPKREAACRFDEFLGRAAAAIVVASPVIQHRERRRTVWLPSQNVVQEIGQLKERFPSRTIILREKSVSLPDVASDLPQRTFEGVDGVHRVWPELIGMLRDWVGLR